MAAKIILFLAVVYTLLITTLSLVQLGEISVGDYKPTDKLLHAGAHFLLAFVWLFYYLFKKTDGNLKSGYLKICLSIVLFGIIIEVLQGVLTTYRQPDWEDVVANSIGVLLALFFFLVFRKFLERVKHQISSFL